MVPINSNPKKALERIETNLKYLIDLDLNEDDMQNDPLGLALYYHFTRKNDMQNINGTTLVSWARTYCFSKLVQREFSKKKDTETTAAILAYATLKNDKGYPETKKKAIERNIKYILETEGRRGRLYFDRPNFTAIILQAIKRAGIEVDGKDELLRATFSRYENNHAFGSLIGLPFLTELLLSCKEEILLARLNQVMQQKLKDHSTEYEDRLYITNALWQYHKAKNTLVEIKELAKSTIVEAPIMRSDIINKGDISDITIREDNLRISRIYKAELLDLMTGGTLGTPFAFSHSLT